MCQGRPRARLIRPSGVCAAEVRRLTYLQTAESRLPLRYRSEIYVNAIKTEGEAARYIAQVTTAIHRAHDDAAKLRTKRAPIRKAAPTAVGEERPAAKCTSKRPRRRPRDGFGPKSRPRNS